MPRPCRALCVGLGLLWLAGSGCTALREVPRDQLGARPERKDVRLATLTNVDVNSTNGVVTLAGQSRSDAERKIEEVARSVHGVVRVNNNVQVVNQ